ncbi:DnaJ subfamily C member 13 [Daphnia magna]|uniref:DnaJ subfamily C member 13 n=1 Tax=Daphnia magna TaxID=35525 RepID=A0A164ZFK0_9CRUS|nr:DnaJ subfamily C member 13 [Daphnia magna]
MVTVIPENQEISSFLVTKLSNWRGKYKRIFTIGTHGVTTYNPNNLEATNQWPYAEIIGIKTVEKSEFVLNIFKKKKRDSMRFICDFRSELLFEFLRIKLNSDQQCKDCWKYDAYKHHWSGIKLPVILEVNPYGVLQLEPTTKQQLAVYPFYEIEGIMLIEDSPNAIVFRRVGFSRLHIFEVPGHSDILQKIQETALANVAIPIRQLKSFNSLNQAVLERLGNYRTDEHLTSLIEFPVHKLTLRHPDAVRRLLCLSETCLLERDPDTYSICTLKPLDDVFAMVRNPDDQQSFSIEFLRGGTRSYRATERDALLATLLDGVRSSGNRDVHIESMHLRWLVQPPSSIPLGVATLRFNCSVNYGGLHFANTQEGIFFSENKEKSIHAALSVLVEEDSSCPQDKANTEEEFLALRRLVATRAGFAAFTHLVGFREKLGLKVVRALQRDRDHVTQAAIDVLCALMEPMYDESDLRQEQLNKSSLLSSPKFLEGILERWTQHVLRGTGALVVISVLDFLTFALCAPYSETTDGAHFDALLAMIAKRGKELFRLLQHPSLSVVKGAGLLMKAVVEEGDESLAARMQHLALSEAALPRHLLTAFYTKKPAGSIGDGRLLLNRQLSRKLVALWTSNNPEALKLFQRILPAGLLSFLDSTDSVPETFDEDLGEGVPNRDNLKIASEEYGRKQNPQWQKAVERHVKTAHKMLAKHVDGALQHWRSRDHALRRQEKPKERPVVLRRRRQRVKAEGNWELLCYQFWKEHALPNLIWNAKTREELREALENQLRTCVQDRELSGVESIAWNHMEFEVSYPSLVDEVRVGDYYLRVLLQHNQPTGCLAIDIKNPVEFFDELYRRFLTAPKPSLRLPCLQAMALVYGRHRNVIGPFPDTEYLITLLERCSDYEERDRLVCLFSQLVNEPLNVKGMLDADGLRSLIDLLPLAHLHTRRAVLVSQSNVIEAGHDMQHPGEKEKEWYYGNAAGERLGPFSFVEMKELFKKGNLNAKSRCWAQGLDGWKSLQNVAIFKWSILATGSPLLNESDLAALILNILIRICEYFPSRDNEGSIIRPLPRVKRILSDALSLPHVVQLLLTFDPILVEKVATLLSLVMSDNPLLSRLFNSGVFFFVMMYTGSNVLPIAKFLRMTHTTQALSLEDSSDQLPRSVLSPMLPEAMIRYLDTYGPEEFSQVFLGEFDTPEVIWGSEMRRLLIEKIAAHLADFTPRLQSNPRALYQFCPIPAIAYPQLEAELFCQAYYLRHLCDTVRFPDWPIKEPVNLLRELLESWKREVEKKPSGMTEDDALTTLGLPKSTPFNDATIRKAYFKLAQQYHPDKNPEGRVMFEKVAVAYQWLCNRNLRVTDGPDAYNILLLLQAQTIVFDRYGVELEPFKYPGYPQLLQTVRLETEDSQLFSKTTSLLGAGVALAYQTVRCSALNAEELRREGGLESFLEAISRCIPMIGSSSKLEDVAVQVCMHASRCLAVAGRFPACRDRLAELKMLTPEICRLLSHRHLPKLCQAACECVASLAQDSVLQLQLLQAGALWHLLIMLFDYDFTLDEGGVSNTLAKSALFACARLGGYLKGSSASPPNAAVQEALSAMLTPYLAGRLGVWTAEEFLKVLTNNTENPVLIWDNSTRSQLLEFLLEQQRTHIRSGESDLTYGATYVHETYAKELIIGGIFARVYNRQPDFQLENSSNFVIHLLDYLTEHSQQTLGTDLQAIDSALQSLLNVIKATPAVALQCLGRFQCLFQLVENTSTTGYLALQVIHLATQQNDCVVDVGSAQLINYLLSVLRSPNSNNVRLCLDIIYTLLSHTPIVKEALAKGGVVFVLDVFCNETDMELRIRSAELLARMTADRLVGGRVRIQMGKFLPVLFADAMRDAPSTAVQLFESSSENPELIWTEEMRLRLSTVLRKIIKRQLTVISQNPKAEWAGIDPHDESELPNLDAEICVGGIYLRLLVANPGWILRKPKEILGELLEAALQGLQKEGETEKTKIIVSAISGLLHSQPVLLEHIPSLGPLPRLLRLLSSSTGSSTVTARLLALLNPMTISSTCIEAFSRLECVAPIASAMHHHPEHVTIALETLEKMITSNSGTEEFAQQSINVELVPQLLKLLEDSFNPHLSSSGRALVVSILKALSVSRLHGCRVTSLLDQSSCWASYRDQRHDLFLQASGSALPIAAGAGVAGYITHHNRGSAGQQHQSPPPPPPTDPLQSRD